MSPFTVSENGRPVAPTYRAPSANPWPTGTSAYVATLCRKSKSDGPHEPERSRGSLFTGVSSDAVRAMQQLNVELSRARLYVYDARANPPRGSTTAPSMIAARARARPVDTSSSTCVNSGFSYANRAVVRPVAGIVLAGTN